MSCEPKGPGDHQAGDCSENPNDQLITTLGDCCVNPKDKEIIRRVIVV